MLLLIILALGCIRSFKLKKFTIDNLILFCITLTTIISLEVINYLTSNVVLIVSAECISMIIVLAFIYTNRKQLGIFIWGVGYTLNMIVRIFNQGKMPVSTKLNMIDLKHIYMTNTTHLKALGDIINLPYPLSIGMKVSSIGDFIVVIGLAIIINQLIYSKN